MINRHGNMALYRVERVEQAARLPWFSGNAPGVTEQYMPIYVVIKDRQPYAAVCTHKQVAQGEGDQPLSPEVAQEIAPLFEPVRVEFDREPNMGAAQNGFTVLQQAVLGAEGGGGGEEGGIGLAEPPVEAEAQGEPPEEAGPVPVNRLKMGGPPKIKPQPKGVDPLAGMRQMTPGDVDTMISTARGEQDPAKAKSLRQQALSMMAQESKRRGESRAQCLVRHLLS